MCMLEEAFIHTGYEYSDHFVYRYLLLLGAIKFTQCAHDDMQPDEERSVRWLEAGSPEAEALRSVLQDKALVQVGSIFLYLKIS